MADIRFSAADLEKLVALARLAAVATPPSCIRNVLEALPELIEAECSVVFAVARARWTVISSANASDAAVESLRKRAAALGRRLQDCSVVTRDGRRALLATACAFKDGARIVLVLARGAS